jgi:ribosomal protein L21
MNRFRFLRQQLQSAPHKFQAQKAAETPFIVTQKTRDILSQLKATDYYAIVEIHSRPYHISKNDIIVVPRMKLQLGDLIALDRIRELGTTSENGFVMKGNPFIRPEFVRVDCCLIEHVQGKDITRRHWKRSGDDTFVTNRESYSLLRVSNIEIKS